MKHLVHKHKRKAFHLSALIIAGVVGALIAILGFGTAVVINNSQPAPTSSITVVDPAKTVQDLPSSPDKYNTSQGATTAPNVPNGNVSSDPVVVPPTSTVDTTVITGGFGGAPLVYAKQSSKGNQPRFSPEQAVAVAINESKTHQSGRDWSGLCEGFAGSYAWGWAYSGQYSAKTAFQAYPSVYTHKITDTSKVPAGAVVYWTEGTYGHATLSIGGGKVASTDILRQGLVDLVPIQLIADRWMGGDKGYWVDPVWFSMAGGSSGLKAPVIAAPPVVNPAPAPPVVPVVKKPIVSLKALRHAYLVPTFSYSGMVPVRKSLGGPSISKRRVPLDKVRYSRWQKSLGYSGIDADGIPGKQSLKALAKKYKEFTVQ